MKVRKYQGIQKVSPDPRMCPCLESPEGITQPKKVSLPLIKKFWMPSGAVSICHRTVTNNIPHRPYTKMATSVDVPSENLSHIPADPLFVLNARKGAQEVLKRAKNLFDNGRKCLINWHLSLENIASLLCQCFLPFRKSKRNKRILKVLNFNDDSDWERNRDRRRRCKVLEVLGQEKKKKKTVDFQKAQAYKKTGFILSLSLYSFCLVCTFNMAVWWLSSH